MSVPSGWADAIENGVLTVNGQPLDRLAARAGSTPFFAYDRRRIADRVALLRRALPAGVGILYAVKANPMPAVVGLLAGLVDGFDVASVGEMKVALDAGMPAGSITFAGPGKSDADLRQAAAAGVTVILEGTDEAERLAATGFRARVMVRVNPAFQIRGGGLRMGGGAQPFGTDAEAVPALMQRIAALPLDFSGFHVFWGSQILDAVAIAEAHAAALALTDDLARQAGIAPARVILGAGYGIPYTASDPVLAPDAAGRGLRAGVGLELGRYLVGEAGIYVCKVLDRKVSRGTVFLVTDGGLHHHLAASGNFGQALKRPFPVGIANKINDQDCEATTVAGRLCTPLDVLARGVMLPRAAAAGDLVVVFQSGAYAASASPTAFLGHPAAVEILV